MQATSCARRRAHLPRRGLRAPRRMPGRSSFQHFPNRLSGNRYRSLLCRSNRRSYQSPNRQLRYEPGRQRAAKPYIEGLIVREFSPISSNWRSEQVTDEYMERYSVPVLAEIDTRALVRHLRTHGVMRGVISTETSDVDALVQKARNIRKMDGTDLAKVVSTKAVVQLSTRPTRDIRETIRCCPTRSGQAGAPRRRV